MTTRAKLIEIIGADGCGKHGLMSHLATNLHQLHGHEPWRMDSPQLHDLHFPMHRKREYILTHWRNQQEQLLSALTDPKVDFVLCKNYLTMSKYLGRIIGVPDQEIRNDHASLPKPDMVVFLDPPGNQSGPDILMLRFLARQYGWYRACVNIDHRELAVFVDGIIQDAIKTRKTA